MPHIHEKYDFTVSAMIIHPNEPKLCLHFHKKLRKWLQPGGHIELDEDPLEALEHELLEETGLILSKCKLLEPSSQPNPRGEKTLPLPIHLNVHSFNKSHKHIDFQYLLKSSESDFSPNNDESPIIKWFTIDEITALHNNDEIFDGTYDICTWIFDNYL
jgi:8-oxo-dGTP pyrophosphatase MutT (NUDIX family)